jgi:hypothetical protein
VRGRARRKPEAKQHTVLSQKSKSTTIHGKEQLLHKRYPSSGLSGLCEQRSVVFVDEKSEHQIQIALAKPGKKILHVLHRNHRDSGLVFTTNKNQ